MATMIDTMENLGAKRLQFSLSGAPTVTFACKRRRAPHGSEETPLFEPYAENLPLQSGYYTFVIDQKGRFRVKWGNTSSHGAMVGYQRVAAAGNFRISRIGRLARVEFISYDYGIMYQGPDDRALVYAIEAFLEHPALDASEHVFFRYSVRRYESYHVNRRRERLNGEDTQRHQERLESEGLDDGPEIALNATQIRQFRSYSPTSPESLYSIHDDQLIITIEEGDSASDFRPGPPYSRFSPETPKFHIGKNNFVIDSSGWLIIGIAGHHILSGGGPVGGAGHILFNEVGKVCAVHLNFSGHYRPPLNYYYVRYVFRALVSHPLLEIDVQCEISGRKFGDADRSTVIRFLSEDLLADDEEAEETLERILV
jgi:hypothetical protein